MTKRQRIFNLLEGKPVDRTPAGFWLHFPEESHHGEAAVEAHIDFMRHTDTDILKVMNENLFWAEGKVYSTRELSKIKTFARKDKIFIDQMDIIKAIAQKAGGEFPIAATVHGLIASAFHATGFSGYYASMGYGLAVFARENPQATKDMLRRVADSLLELVDCSLEAGADGIFYATLGGERQFFTEEEFAEFVAPLEAEIYRHIQSKTKFDILHLCKSNINFERYTALKPAIVNWSVYQNGLSVSEGAKLFPESIILGGFQDRSGLLVEGTPEQIAAHTASLLEEMKGKRFIVGSDCTLPTEISYQRINSVVKAIESSEKAAR